MDIIYENGAMIITHSTDVVNTYTRKDYERYLEQIALQAAKLQTNLDEANKTLALIDASKTNSISTTQLKE